MSFAKGREKDKDSPLVNSLSISSFLASSVFLTVNTIMVILNVFLNIYPKDKMALKNARKK